MGMKVLMLNQVGMSEEQKAKRFQASCVEEMRYREKRRMKQEPNHIVWTFLLGPKKTKNFCDFLCFKSTYFTENGLKGRKMGQG